MGIFKKARVMINRARLSRQAKANRRYKFYVEVLDNLVYVVMVDEKGDEVSRGHGHIFHEGAFGVAQAASYSMKKLAEKLNGGRL